MLMNPHPSQQHAGLHILQQLVSPSPLVMGGDTCSKGREFESQLHLLERHFSHKFAAKNEMFV